MFVLVALTHNYFNVALEHTSQEPSFMFSSLHQWHCSLLPSFSLSLSPSISSLLNVGVSQSYLASLSFPPAVHVRSCGWINLCPWLQMPPQRQRCPNLHFRPCAVSRALELPKTHLFGCPAEVPESTRLKLNSLCSAQNCSFSPFISSSIHTVAQASDLSVILSFIVSFAATFNQSSLSDRLISLKWLKSSHVSPPTLLSPSLENNYWSLDYCNSPPIQSGLSKLQIWPCHPIA